LAGADSSGDHWALDGLENLAFLVSYWYILHGKGWNVIKYSLERGIPLFLDSGAFSAMTLGAKIDIDEYIEFCRRHGDKFEVIASLDVIGDWKKTKINHDKMRQAGINSIPTFHVREPFDFLCELLESNDYIALGVAGMQRRRRAIIAWLTKCFKLRKEIRPDCRFHGFALTSSQIIRFFPWHSIDSSTWINARRFGNIIVREQDGFRQIGRHQRWQLKQYYGIPSGIFVPRKASTCAYNALLKHNAGVMIEWTQSLTQHE